jgi:pimeloyl-ACP methyl ester carboxylesterase
VTAGKAVVAEGQVTHRSVATNGIRLHVATTGPEDGPLVILLHGFPEFWYGWRHQIPHLAEAGFRVWAPDQRGYNLSEKPKGLAAYSIDQLAADVVGLVEAAGCETASLVAHDWGAGVAWWTAAKFPERIKRIVIINAPHWQVFREHLRRNPAQMRKSWYILFFQIPWVPELLAGWMMRRPTEPGSEAARMFTNGDPEAYRRAWRQPGALTATINWYRAAARGASTLPPDRQGGRIRVPTLLIWGSRDEHLVREMAQPSIELCDHGSLVYFEEASHWLHHEMADQVNPLISGFLKA